MIATMEATEVGPSFETELEASLHFDMGSGNVGGNGLHGPGFACGISDEYASTLRQSRHDWLSKSNSVWDELEAQAANVVQARAAVVTAQRTIEDSREKMRRLLERTRGAHACAIGQS